MFARIYSVTNLIKFTQVLSGAFKKMSYSGLSPNLDPLWFGLIRKKRFADANIWGKVDSKTSVGTEKALVDET